MLMGASRRDLETECGKQARRANAVGDVNRVRLLAMLRKPNLDVLGAT